MIICQQNVGSCTFSDEIFSSTTVFILLHMGQQSNSYSEHLLFFSFRLFYLSTRFLFVLTLESIAICKTCFRVSDSPFWQFLVLFWMFLMLLTMHKPCHVPLLSQVITSGTKIMEICFGVSKE